jgi:hypothetical protein
MTRDGRESTYPWVNSWQRGRIGKQAPGARWPPTPQYSISRCSPTVMVRGDRLDQATARHRLDLPSIRKAELQ